MSASPTVGSLEDFMRERNAALIELSEENLRSFYKKWNGKELPENPIVFWGAIHKAVTGCSSLPIEHRRKSKAWLDELGLQSLDDGDL